MDDPQPDLTEVYDATTRYLRTLDGLTSESLAEPSLLPGWSRAHVVAHLARHALGFTRALDGARRSAPVPVYDSPEAREAGIEETAALPADDLREFSLDACGRWRDAAEHAPDPDAVLELFPGGRRLTAAASVGMRLFEVEIHHADLGCDYGPGDWPDAFLDRAFNTVVDDRQDGPSMMLRTPDGDVLIGSGYGPAVTGSRADLTWWLLGRGEGRGLTTDGELPTLGPWTRRTPAT
ncbi:maleylpyruvate isomerase family mycothiol-dependent enzyme [Nocardioides donggukensis]|uniref:Maleylpyruvate isomerase N-terminal domain-containing protein n=1 Tax=Nocardioides donggukensis TaxID=2774019 RepID=A0A927K3I0_9ACTN|nr:maleylpyruvate isomerase family mycothiol-dependent enzyme [Nocardioides donggukensis]MBD8869362.1 maleylpyruvate isomerase N-terminal domain-containing protein [Nocardioides donggukensis]